MRGADFSKWKPNILLGYWALVLAAVFLGETRLVPDWGQWYSKNLAYREQTEALMHGNLALHDSPGALRLDLAWYNGGVQQVWGLGVPAWRLPFECLARIFGQPAFPDRLAFGAAFAVTAYFVFQVILLPGAGEGGSIRQLLKNPLRLASAAVLLLFPPFIEFCSVHFDVYEEAVAYGYLVGISLFLGVVAFARNPRKGIYYALCAWAGLSPFFRPTVGAYGLLSAVLLFFISRRAGFKRGQSATGTALFCLGGLLLFVTNQIRFGSGFEFGHSINLNGFPIWFFDRIYNPFQHEPLISAAKDLFGSAFLRPMNGAHWNKYSLFWGQSPTPRWRLFYATCFDLSFVPLILAGWFSCGTSLAWRGGKSINPWPVECRLAMPWSLGSAVILTAFYLRAPVMSNRYIFDFGPSFAVALAGLMLSFEPLRKRFPVFKGFWAVLILGCTTAWICAELHFAKNESPPTPATDLNTLMDNRPPQFAMPDPLPDVYKAGEDLSNFGIPFNGEGWRANGDMETVAVLFLQDVNGLQIELAPADLPHYAYSNITAKVGLEFLTVKSMAASKTNCIITFDAPKRQVYRQGIQEVFLAYIDREYPTTTDSPLRLLRVEALH